MLTFQARFILAKIKGEILIENKRKAAIVEQLVKKGFDPDPVKRWKELQRKRELEMTGEVQVDDEEIEGEEEVCFLPYRFSYVIFILLFKNRQIIKIVNYLCFHLHSHADECFIFSSSIFLSFFGTKKEEV